MRLQKKQSECTRLIWGKFWHFCWLCQLCFYPFSINCSHHHQPRSAGPGAVARRPPIPTFSPTLPFLEDSPGRTSKFPLFSTEWQFHFHFSIDRTVSAQQWMKPVDIIASVKDTRLNVGCWWNLLKSILFMTRRCQLLEGRGTNQTRGSRSTWMMLLRLLR